MRKLNWKEKFVAFLLLLVGTIFLISWIVSISSEIRRPSEAGMISLRTSDLMTHIRSIATFLVALSGGLLLLKKRTFGWVLSLSVLLLFATIVTGILLAAVERKTIDPAFIIGIAALAVLITAMIFLFLKPTRQKFRIDAMNYITAIVLFILLSILYFLLQ